MASPLMTTRDEARVGTDLARARHDEIVAAERDILLSGDPIQDVEILRIGSQRGPGTALRRLLFVWLRIFVAERKSSGDWQRVDVRLPIPLPLIGLMLRRKLDGRSAMRLLARIEDDPEPGGALGRQLDAFTGFELIRVEENKPGSGKSQLVVIGID